MSEEKTKKSSILNKGNHLVLYGVVGLVLFILIVLFSIHRLSIWQKDVRDAQRTEVLENVVSEIENMKEENEHYPEAVFFKSDSVLICSKIDCFVNREVSISGSARGTSDILNKTDKNYTKYRYELENEIYKVGFCNEDGEIRNFGKAPFGEELNCD